MSIFSLAGSLLGIGKGVKDLFGKKKKDPTPRDNLLSQAQGATEAEKQYGINRLTMLQYGQPGGAYGVAGGGDAPPLASIDLITGGLKDINDITSGDAARRRAADQLELDLAKVKIDQAKSQIALDNARLGQMLSSATFGRRAATASNGQNARTVNSPFAGPYLGREVDVEKVPSTSGVALLDTPVLARPYVVPATGADGLDEVASAAAAVSYQKQQDWRESMAERARLSMSGTPDQKAKAHEEYARDMFRHPPGMTGLWTRAMGVWDVDVRKDLKKRKGK
ncbi:hypothetical protein [Paracoccus alkenifer]|uniref:DNA pilot protein n=1 Tax=Paracoccus alkenifer TaxID=65735 RepID=A0A1H6M1E3_9RHOB|nr:hypothetical protein [Paracoccus alkenifer]SEH91196.1 hypothetical protein SAMN04488075_1785 [Paracoccus alkenifer]